MKKRSIVTIACLSIVLCVALIMGGTYALFSSRTTVTNHLRSGNLTLKLERVGLTKYVYDETSGVYKENVYSNGDAYVDFSESTDKNVFDLARSEVMAPGVWYEATMRIGKAKGHLSDYVTATDGNEIVVSSGKIGMTEGAKTFKIKLLFDPTADNNAVMDSATDFDLIVEATQATD